MSNKEKMAKVRAAKKNKPSKADMHETRKKKSREIINEVVKEVKKSKVMTPYMIFKKSQGRKPKGLDKEEWKKQIRMAYKEQRKKDKKAMKKLDKGKEEMKAPKTMQQKRADDALMKAKEKKEAKQLQELNLAIATNDHMNKPLPSTLLKEKETKEKKEAKQLKDLNILIAHANKKLPAPKPPKKTAAVKALPLSELHKLFHKAPIAKFPSNQVHITKPLPKRTPKLDMRSPLDQRPRKIKNEYFIDDRFTDKVYRPTFGY